jgi:hypothetical protein
MLMIVIILFNWYVNFFHMRVMMLMDMMWHMDNEMCAENKLVFVSSTYCIFGFVSSIYCIFGFEIVYL